MDCHADDANRGTASTPHAQLQTAPSEGACCDAEVVTEWRFGDTTERRLLGEVSAGSRSALRRLHWLYFPRLATFLTHVAATTAAHVIEDLISDTMFDVWRKSAMLVNEASVHVAIMRLAWTHGSKSISTATPPVPVPEPPDVQTRPSQPPAVARPLSEVLATLSAIERAAFHLVQSRHSRREVAQILSMSCKSVDACLARAMSALRPHLTSSGSEPVAASRRHEPAPAQV